MFTFPKSFMLGKLKKGIVLLLRTHFVTSNPSGFDMTFSFGSFQGDSRGLFQN